MHLDRSGASALKPLWVVLATAALVLAGPLDASAQPEHPSVVTTEHVRAELVVHAPDGIRAGTDVWLGLAIEHAPHWHTYWKNPGDSGLPTTLRWTLPDSIEAGDIEWPTPQPLPVGPLMNFGYDGRVLLPVRITVPAGFAAPTLDVALRADWLVCEEICIPESGEFSLLVPTQTAATRHAPLFEDAWSRMPHTFDQVRTAARIENQALIVQIDGLPMADQQPDIRFFAETGGVIEHAALIVQRWDGARWVATIPLSAQRSESPAILHAVLVATGQQAGTRVSLSITDWTDSAAAPATATTVSTPLSAPPPIPVLPSSTSFLATLALALLGGLLLNLMPCVFPVLSLKVLGLAQPGPARRTRLAGGLAYTAGVMVSFLALAGLLLALRAGGEHIGWGFQLQSPVFVAALAALFTLIGLNLAGVFDIAGVLPNRLAAFHARHPLADHAWTGLLAGAVASPCTGPFMGVALGVALTLSATQALAIFAALGLGMALPYLAVSAMPGLVKHAPRPGAWMVQLKVLLAFPMFATVVWLVWILGQQIGNDGVAGVLALLVALSFAAWSVGSVHLGRKARAGFGVVALLLLATAAVAVGPTLLSPQRDVSTVTTESDWQPWSRTAVAAAQAAGRPVFVDFTAAWCVTCQWNKRTTLSDPAVLADFARRDVLLLRADWTRQDPHITQALTGLGRSGVPVYALYNASTPTPVLLPEILHATAVHHALANLPLASADVSRSTVSPRSP